MGEGRKLRYSFIREPVNCFYRTGNVSNFYNAMDGSIWSANLVLAINSGLWSFNGFESLNFGIEEIEDPKRC